MEGRGKKGIWDKGIAGIANPHSTTHKVCLETESLYSQKDRWVMFATETWQRKLPIDSHFIEHPIIP